MPKDNVSTDNHELLILVSGKVDSLARSMEQSIANNALEFEKIWKHQDERDQRQSAALQLTADKLASSIATVADKQNNSGKPNIQAIVAVCMLIGGVAVAFIAPIKADIARGEEMRKEIAEAVIVRQEAIQELKSKLVEFQTDLKWMRGEKKNLTPPP